MLDESKQISSLMKSASEGGGVDGSEAPAAMNAIHHLITHLVTHLPLVLRDRMVGTEKALARI
jgi:hypothetical protein